MEIVDANVQFNHHVSVSYEIQCICTLHAILSYFVLFIGVYYYIFPAIHR